MAAPYSNPFTYAQILDKIDSIIGSTLATTWTDAKKEDLVDTALAEISEAVPYVMVDTYQLETRRGIATSTSGSNLVDATNSHFVSTAADAGKIVYNTTDKTWAVIESYTSATTVVLSAAIMAVGEGYEIYNKGCWNNRQINIEDSGDFLGVIGAVYPVSPNLMFSGAMDNMHNIKLLSQNKIAEIDTWYVDNTGNATADKDVHLYLARQHKLNIMTDLAGATSAAGAVGDKTIAVASFAVSETVFKNMLFTVALISGISSRLTYRMTADAALTGTGTGTLLFWPGFEAVVDSGAVVTFIGSTLTPDLERILIDIVTGQILMAEGISTVNNSNKGGPTVGPTTFNIGRDILKAARQQLKALIDVDLRSSMIWAR